VCIQPFLRKILKYDPSFIQSRGYIATDLNCIYPATLKIGTLFPNTIFHWYLLINMKTKCADGRHEPPHCEFTLCKCTNNKIIHIHFEALRVAKFDAIISG
jgi:hypothetical protein